MLPILFSLGPIVIHSFGVLLLLAVVLGSFVFWQRAGEENYDEEEVFDLLLGCIVWALVAARMIYVVGHFDEFGLNILLWLSLWSRPGFYWLGMYGGAVVYMMRFCKRKKWDFFEVGDLGVIGVSLASALVHLGLFLAGSGLGKMTRLPVGVVFPGLYEKRHPVALYGAVMWLVAFGLLWWLEGKYRRFGWYQRHKGDSRPGFLVFSYLIILGVVGLLVGLVSEPVNVVGGVSVDLVLRGVVMVVGAVGLYMRSGLRRPLVAKKVRVNGVGVARTDKSAVVSRRTWRRDVRK